MDANLPARWDHVKKFLLRRGPFVHPEFEPDEGNLEFLRQNLKLLVIGAGGLGCELLKDLVSSQHLYKYERAISLEYKVDPRQVSLSSDIVIMDQFFGRAFHAYEELFGVLT